MRRVLFTIILPLSLALFVAALTVERAIQAIAISALLVVVLWWRRRQVTRRKWYRMGVDDRDD